MDINDLPDSDFAYIEPGGTKDAEGKTVPRSLRHFPIHDAAHVRNALARLDQSPFGPKARAKVEAAAKRMGIGAPAGKAETDDDDVLDLTQDEIDAEVLAGDEEPDDDGEEVEGKAGPKFIFGRPNPAYTAQASKRDVQSEMDAIRSRAQARGLRPTEAQVRRTFERNFARRQAQGIRARARAKFGRNPSERAVQGTLRRNLGRDARLAALAGGRAPGKAFLELKAQDFTHRQLDAWLAGEISRRILVLPFGGPLPGGPKGRDLDGEFFDERTDIYGPFPWLRSTRERLVDWHHDDMNVPPDVARMKGAVIGRIVLDDEPEEDGYWADWWAKAGERRLALVKLLEKNRVPLYGSTEPVKGSTHVESDGHIDLWPIIRHTITTSPQNTWAVVPPLKALLTDPDVSFDDVGLVAVKAALVGIDVLTTDLRESSSGDGLPGASVAAGRGHVEDDPALREFLEGLALTIPKLERILT